MRISKKFAIIQTKKLRMLRPTGRADSSDKKRIKLMATKKVAAKKAPAKKAVAKKAPAKKAACKTACCKKAAAKKAPAKKAAKKYEDAVRRTADARRFKRPARSFFRRERLL